MRDKPTEADRLTAALFVTRLHQTEELAVSRLAEILAAEREKVRAPFLALLDELEERARATGQAANEESLTPQQSHHVFSREPVGERVEWTP